SCSLIAALVCALPSCGHAQSGAPATGTVTEPGGRPLSGVVVAVQGLGLSVATDATGRYVLSRVPAGQQLLQFRRIGFAAREVTVIVPAGTPATADAVLDPQPIDLGTVVVEGVSRAPERMIDAPAAVDVVRPATAEPLSITGQVPLALARVPGLDVTQSGMNDFNVNARGFNTMLTRKMLVLQDGRDLATALVIRQTWGGLAEPLEDLGRIEVIRGPGSALYGANAYNGVINITTPPARDVVGTKLTLGGGELGTPDPLVTVYGSARVDYYAANRSIVTLEGGAAQEENPVFTIGSGRNQARRLVRPWARLAWDAGGSGVSAWYSGFSLPEMV